MNTYLDCIPCFLRQSLEAARMATDDMDVQADVLREVMRYLGTISLEKTPPETSTTVHKIIRQITGCSDPYADVKRKSNEAALQLYPKLKKFIENSDDRLLTATKLAIGGNIIDYGTPNRFDVEKTIKYVLQSNLGTSDYRRFKRSVANANQILYIADNAGEIVFDKVLLEQLNTEILFAVKPAPIINDATIEDAKRVGIDKIAKLVSIGAQSPGAILNRCSKEFIAQYNIADMIIAKGQGNYESLPKDNKIYFLLMVKCELVARDLGVALGDIVLKNGGK